ncbi:MAG TPA: YqgE/AlgH family protein [Woeseiaceae bacterium]|nr:YqgE/AlgH family protein [Woeseiaceae bacterium]
MQPEASFSNQLLIAMPGMLDPNFSSTVTLICEHNAEGALGIVINRPMNLKLGGLFEQLDVGRDDAVGAERPVFDGGPVARERGFVLHNPGARFESSVAVSPEIQLTLSRDVLESIAAGQGPAKSLVALGYAGWQPGQLEAEMLANTWLSVPATPEIVFDVPYSERWISAARVLGVDISRLTPDAGHA